MDAVQVMHALDIACNNAILRGDNTRRPALDRQGSSLELILGLILPGNRMIDFR